MINTLYIQDETFYLKMFRTGIVCSPQETLLLINLKGHFEKINEIGRYYYNIYEKKKGKKKTN